MSNKGYITFLKFDDVDAINAYAEVLTQNNISFQLEDESYSVDPILQTPGTTIRDFRLKLKPVDFDKANALLERVFEAEINSIDKGYFIFEFTDDELLDVVKKPDEWGHLNYVLAKKLLNDKGITIDKATVEKFENERIKELKKPDKSSNAWIVAAYLAAIFGLFLGVFIGAMLVSFKKTLPNGERVYAYSEQNRKHGLIILIIGLITTTTGFIIRYYTNISIFSR